MVLQMPPTTKSLANRVIVLLTTPPTATTGIPDLSEVNAALFAQLHIYGSFDIMPNQSTGEGPTPLGQAFSPTVLGRVTYEAIQVQYSYMPQLLGTPGEPGNEVYEALPQGARITGVVLDGLSGKSDTAAEGDVSDVYLLDAGARGKGRTGDGEFDKKVVMQTLVVANGGEPIAIDHPLAAAV